jgi:L-ascorbate metabolism protein UlaG (beta-lactamase superfamily)
MLLDALEWLGHSGFRVNATGAVVYIDPYRVAGGPKADAILITHGHYDHFSPLVVQELSQDSTWFVAPASVAERVGGQVVAVRPGDVVEVASAPGIAIRAVSAYNTSKRDASGHVFHPPEAGLVGYELNVRGERLYHSGDTDVIPEMDSVAGVDVALLPVSGTYVMTAAEAAEAARRIQPRVAVPMHWGEHIGTYDDAVEFARMAPVQVEIMQPAK